MSRRNKGSRGSPVSLFPFLSILACMIGTLTLMITALALTSMGAGRNDDSIRRAEDYVALKKETASYQKRVDTLHKLQQKAKRLEQRIATVQALLKSQGTALVFEQKEARLKEQIKSVQLRTADLEKEFVRLQKELDSLREELAKRQQTFSEDLVKVLPPKGVATTRFKPFFVEAGKSGIVVYEGEEPYKVKSSDITKNKRFNDFLTALADNESAQLVVLVRNNGLSAMRAVISRAEGRGINCGKLPLVGMGEVDLSSF